MIEPKVKIKDKGGDRLAAVHRQMDRLTGSYVTVGVHPYAGNYPSGVPVSVIAATQEFGSPEQGIPQRSFIRATVDAKMDRLNAMRIDLVGKIIDGKLTPKKALDILGTYLQVQVQNRIDSNIGPRLSPAYARWKVRQGKPPRTLVLTRLLYRSITYAVRAE